MPADVSFDGVTVLENKLTISSDIFPLCLPVLFREYLSNTTAHGTHANAPLSLDRMELIRHITMFNAFSTDVAEQVLYLNSAVPALLST